MAFGSFPAFGFASEFAGHDAYAQQETDEGATEVAREYTDTMERMSDASSASGEGDQGVQGARASAQQIEAGEVVRGALDDVCAEDWYAFELAETAMASITWLEEAQDESGAWVVRIEAEEEDAEPLSLQEFAVGADGEPAAEQVELCAGTYYVCVGAAANGWTDSEYAFVLDLSPTGDGESSDVAEEELPEETEGDAYTDEEVAMQDDAVAAERREGDSSAEERSEELNASPEATEVSVEDTVASAAQDASLVAQASGVVASGTCGTCRWSLDANGTLTIGGGTLVSNDSRNTSWRTYWPWDHYQSQIRSVVSTGRVVVGQDASFMFQNCSSMQSLDVSGWDTSKVTNASMMFQGCESLTSLDVSRWNTSRMTSVTYMFNGCRSLTSLDVSRWDTSSMKDFFSMFQDCSSLNSLDVSRWNTSKITSLWCTFLGCTSLTTLDVSGWNTSSLREAYATFSGCSSLVSLDLSGWNTSRMDSTTSLFRDCSSLTSLDLSGWNTSKLGNKDYMTSGMFAGCTSLASLKVGASYAIANVNMIPDATASNGKWWSLVDQAWYTKDHIVANRSGIADVYTNTQSTSARISVSKATVAKVADKPYTGKAVKPTPKVSYGGRTLTRGTDYTLSYANNTKAGTATITVRGKGAYTGSKKVTFKIVAPTASYSVHVQTYGDQASRTNGAIAGTSGESKRLEAIRISLGSGFPVSGGITYRTHVQTYGWQGWKSNGAMSGTSGERKRLEAIQIKLTGEMANKYDVWYRVHAQQFGWMGWAKNGASAGTAGYSYRLEAIQVVLKAKGGSAPPATYQGATQATADAFRDASANISLYDVYLPVLQRAQAGTGEFAGKTPGEFMYFVFDFGADGVPELLLQNTDVPFSGWRMYVFTVRAGKLEYMGSYSAVHEGPSGNAQGQLFMSGGEQSRIL